MTETKFPISEIFGPTIQGEGIHVGRRSQFVRFAGCDTCCEWCDTKYAWQINELWTDDMILSEVLPTQAPIVTLTGGNPLLYSIDSLITKLHRKFQEIHVETQGTLWKDWLNQVDFISVSPKKHHLELDVLDKIINSARHGCQLKVVVFTYDDIAFLNDMYDRYRGINFIVQVGWPSHDMSWIADYVSNESRFDEHVRVLPQIHRIFWGDTEGV